MILILCPCHWRISTTQYKHPNWFVKMTTQSTVTAAISVFPHSRRFFLNMNTCLKSTTESASVHRAARHRHPTRASTRRSKSSTVSRLFFKIEHIFLIVKRDFGYRKVVYRGIAKNMNRFHVLFGCANLLMCIRDGLIVEFCKGQLCQFSKITTLSEHIIGWNCCLFHQN